MNDQRMVSEPMRRVDTQVQPLDGTQSTMPAMNDQRMVSEPMRRVDTQVQPLGEVFVTVQGNTLYLRPIRSDDGPALRRGFARLTSEQIRQRVFHRMTELSQDDARRLANVTPMQGAAFVATDADGEIRGDARLYLDPGERSAEFAIIVDPSLTGQGVGRILMHQLIVESRRRGLTELWGYVLSDNILMLDFVNYLGAQRSMVPGEPGTVRVHFDLNDPRVDADWSWDWDR
ncbi:MAG: GNAT family N-acetyltransferase [Rhodanobacter sp.]|nr:GNAT family N-acetyltransferase [Rhodanobacter sp.]